MTSSENCLFLLYLSMNYRFIYIYIYIYIYIKTKIELESVFSFAQFILLTSTTRICSVLRMIISINQVLLNHVSSSYWGLRIICINSLWDIKTTALLSSLFESWDHKSWYLRGSGNKNNFKTMQVFQLILSQRLKFGPGLIMHYKIESVHALQIIMYPHWNPHQPGV